MEIAITSVLLRNVLLTPLLIRQLTEKQLYHNLKKQKLPTKSRKKEHTREMRAGHVSFYKKYVERIFHEPCKYCRAESWHETARESQKRNFSITFVKSKRNQLIETQSEYHIATNSVTFKSASAASLIHEGINTVSVLN
jgi:hypothetical protein